MGEILPPRPSFNNIDNPETLKLLEELHGDSLQEMVDKYHSTDKVWSWSKRAIRYYVHAWINEDVGRLNPTDF